MAKRKGGEGAPVGAGERKENSRKKAERALGKRAIDATVAEDKWHGRRRRHERAEQTPVEEGTPNNKSEQISEAELEAYAQSLRDEKDKRGGQKYSEATIQRAIEARKKGEDFDLQAYEDEQQKLAREEYEKKRQAEIEKILAGRTAEVAAREMTRDMKKLAAEIERMNEEVYLDPGMREYHRKQLEEATRQYGAMGLRRDMILETMSEAQQESVIYEAEEESPVSGAFDDVEGTAGANTAEKMSVAALDAVMSMLGEQDAELRQLLEEKKAELEQKAEGTDEEEQSSTADPESQDDSGTNEPEQGDYWQRMAALAAEAEDNPGRWMSEEERQALAEKEQSAERRERLVQDVWGKMKARIPFRRAVASAIVGLGLTIMVGFAGQANTMVAQAATTNTMSNSEGRFDTFDVGGGQEDAEADTEADITMEERVRRFELSQALGIDVEDLMNAGEINYEGVDLLTPGEKMYAGAAEREGTQVLPNGLTVNLLNYEAANRENGTNNFGTSKEWLFDLEEARESTTAQELLEAIRDQPQTMAAFVANYPTMLAACGVDASIIESNDLVQRAQGVMNLLFGENGGDLQKKLLAASGIALFNENTDYEFYLENRLERTFSMVRAEEDNFTDATKIGLGVNTVKRNNTKQVQIVFSFANGTQESSDLNLPCKFQPNMLVFEGVTTQPIITTNVFEQMEVEIVPEVIPETPVVPPIVIMPEPEEPEPTPTPPEQTPTPTPTPTPPEPTPTPTPPEPTPPEPTPEEEIKPKDEEGQKEVVEEGGQTNSVDQTENIGDKTPGIIETPSNQDPDNQTPQEDITGNLTGTYDKTEENTVIPGSGAEQGVTNNQVVDQTVNTDQQVVNQNNANENYNNGPSLNEMTDDEFNEYVDSLL